MPAAASLVAEGISPTTGPGREGKGTGFEPVRQHVVRAVKSGGAPSQPADHHQTTPSVPTPPMAKESARPSEDASERRSAKAQDLNPPTVPRVIRVPRAADTENEPSSSSDRPRAPVPAPSSPTEQTDRRSGQQPVSSGVKRDARAAELPDEDERGGNFQQVEGLTTVDAEEIPCEFSVEDDFMIHENTEGVNEEIVKAFVAGKEEGARRDGSIRNL